MLENLWMDCSAWWATVTPAFTLLLTLPFVVAAAGFLGDTVRNRRARRLFKSGLRRGECDSL